MPVRLFKHVPGNIVETPHIGDVIVIEEHVHLCLGVIPKLGVGDIAVILCKELLQNIVQLFGGLIPIDKSIHMDKLVVHIHQFG